MSWHERAAAVWQHQDEMEGPLLMGPSEDVERPPLERVLGAKDGYALRKPIEVVVGSVSLFPSTPSTTDGWYGFSSTASRTSGSCD